MIKKNVSHVGFFAAQEDTRIPAYLYYDISFVAASVV
jgi:hypothetical protein